ncbi:hypothetical protein Q5752_003709 [Cryptotrichosporon argae]
MLTRPLSSLLRPVLSGSRRASRWAHAAAAPRDIDDQGEPVAEASTSAAAAASASVRRSAANGKRRESDGYRFPSRGRNGDPPDPYEVLGLDRGASDKDVKRQYYRLALVLHPDSSHPSSSAENFSTLHRAYTLLSDPVKGNTYRQTGLGWAGGAEPSSSPYDDALRAEVLRRRRAGASEWGYGRGGFREAEFARRAAHAERGWQPYDADGYAHNPEGKREQRYMSNGAFLSVVLGTAMFVAYFQWLRLGSAADTARGVLMDRHVIASHALAEARQEASLYGKERRERIRRRVRENEVLREMDRLERGAAAGTGHTAATVPAVPGLSGRRRKDV